MSLIQRMMMAILPKTWAEDMRRDSLRWHIICTDCGHKRSIWEIGGIRWKAVGNSRTYFRCVQCGKHTWQRLEYLQ
jgi:DNA-directed RNA polymerase subunit RPC12/RpoP